MPSMTRSQLVTRVGQLTADPSNTRFSTSEKQAELDRAQENFVLDTGCLKDVASTITVVDGTAEYDLPTDLLDIMRVAHKGNKLERLSKYDLDVAMASDWSSIIGTPRTYYPDLDPDNLKIHLFPIPQAADAGANLVIEYIKIPASLSTDASVPFGGNVLLYPYHDALAFWASHMLLQINPSQGDLVTAANCLKQYKELVMKCINKFKNMANTSPKNIFRGRNPFNLGK